MDGLRSILLLTGMALSLMITEGEGCSCVSQHPQEHFCGADFVIKARVKRVAYIENEQRRITYINHTIVIRDVFKSTDVFENATKTQLYSAGSGSMCGVELYAKNYYLVMGTVSEGGDLYVSSCDIHANWAVLSDKQILSLSTHYQQSCYCTINVCSSSNCQEDESDKDGCYWNPSDDPGACYTNHGFCKRGQNGRCGWLETAELDECLLQE